MEKKLILPNNLNPFLLAILFITAADSIGTIGPFYLIVRLIIFSLSFYIVLYKKFISIPLLIGVALITLSLVIHTIMIPSSIKINFRPAMNILHPFILYIIFSNIDNKSNIFSLNNAIIFLRISYIAIFLSLILGHLTGLGDTIGSRGAIEGLGGFFIGKNEIGIILIMVVIFAYWIKDHISRIELFFIMFCTMVLGIAVFTKSAMIASLIAFIFLDSKIIKTFLIVASLIAVIRLFPKIMGLIDFLYNETFFSAIEDGIIEFLFRGRTRYIDAFFNGLDFRFDQIIELLFIGFGNHFISHQIINNYAIFNGAIFKDFEMDYLDLFFGFGLLFTLFYTFYLIKLLIRIGKYSNWKISFLLLLIVLHAIMAGHVFFSTQVINMVIIFFFFVKYNYYNSIAKED